MEKDRLDNKKRIVLKLGSSTLTKGSLAISRGKIEDIARQIKVLSDSFQFVIVSSGAIAAAKQFVGLRNQDSVMDKQALASIGQPHLMRIYYEIFSELGLLTAQCLLTYFDFENEVSRHNIQHTIYELLKNNYIPIINENDTVATEEINFGDNDKLAALVADLIDTDLLVMATNTYGLYDADPQLNPKAVTIPLVDDLHMISQHVGESKSDLGSGGMKSKILAAKIAQAANIETWLINGFPDNFLIDVMDEKVPFTRII